MKVLLNQPATAQTASGFLAASHADENQQLEVNINVTAVSGTGTPTLVCIVEGQDPAGNWYPLWTSSSITAAGDTSQAIGAGLQTDVVVPPIIRFRWTITGTTPSFTFSATIIAKVTD